MRCLFQSIRTRRCEAKMLMASLPTTNSLLRLLWLLLMAALALGVLERPAAAQQQNLSLIHISEPTRPY